MHAIKNSSDLSLHLIVTGGHLDPNFGNTIDEIRTDGFEISKVVDLDYDKTAVNEVPLAIGSCICGVSDALRSLQPDVLVVYADRFEGFGAVVAASQMNIPVAHIEGGDLTEGGALDDSVRHAMTKLSHIHFATNSQAQNRILAMGEERWRVLNVGFPGLDGLAQGDFEPEGSILKHLGFKTGEPIVLFTQHSITTEPHQARSQVQESLLALRRLLLEGVQVVATYPNNDWGASDIIEELIRFQSSKPGKFRLIPSLGRRRYHGVLNLASNEKNRVVCLGNSSSGLKETPAFNCPAVNIGNRQKGRLSGENVIHCLNQANSIYEAVQKGLYDENFRRICRQSMNPYGIGNSGKKMCDYLSNVALDADLLKKKMTLAGEERNGWFK